MNVTLREAMRRADLDEFEEVAGEIGREAIAVALAERPATVTLKPDLEEERQQMLDAALADAIEIVNRHRARVGRRICTQADGKAVRLIFETLRGMAGPNGGADNDSAWQ